MSAGAYMGAAQAQALIGRWQDIVGRATDTRGNYSVGADLVLGPRPAQYGGGGGRRDWDRGRRDWGRRDGYRPWDAYQQQPAYDPYAFGDPNACVDPNAYQGPTYQVQPQAPVPPPESARWDARHWEEWRRRHHKHHHHHPVATVQAAGLPWFNVVGKDAMPGMDGFPPRNLLVNAPEPQRGGREVLPMSVDGPILPGQSAQITARPQRVAFRPERVFISAASDATLGAAAWLVNDIKIGNRSQFSQSGSVPGDMFATVAIDSFVSFETAQTAMDVVMVVTYIGSNSDGVSFYGAIIGTAAI
jgi:hypothetical protein